MRNSVADGETIRNIQNQIRSQGIASAWPAAEAALTDGLVHPLLYRLRGIRCEGEGQLAEAATAFAEALKLEPDHPPTLDALSLCLSRLGHLDQAKILLHRALTLDPQMVSAHVGLAWVLENQGEVDAAMAAYERAAELDPRHAAAQAGIAVLAARRGRWDQARERAQAALSVEPANATALIALATAELGEQQPAAAEARLLGLLSDRAAVSAHAAAVARSLLGDSLYAQAQHGPAFAAWTAANAALRDLYASRFGPGRMEPALETGQQLATRLNAAFDPAQDRRWTAPSPAPPIPGGAAGHVFLTGFPRSGTTLLGQILASHPAVTTLDEVETLAGPAREFLGSDDGIDRLAGLAPAAAEAHRAAYWQQVQMKAGNLAGRQFIDKLATQVLGLPLIAQLFPVAKILLVRRDPRDVVLSCFRHQFGINPTTWEFLALTSTARFYDSVMTLTERYLARFNFDLSILRYEDLVEDFDGETAKLCEFIGVDWQAGLSAFGEQSKTRVVRTVSGGQVARGLYREGIGQWRDFAAELAPVLPLLEPWVQRFGYAPR